MSWGSDSSPLLFVKEKMVSKQMKPWQNTLVISLLENCRFNLHLLKCLFGLPQVPPAGYMKMPALSKGGGKNNSLHLYAISDISKTKITGWFEHVFDDFSCFFFCSNNWHMLCFRLVVCRSIKAMRPLGLSSALYLCTVAYKAL